MDDIEKLIKDAQLQVEQEEKFKEEQRIYEEEKAKEAELIRQAEEIYNPAPVASTNVTPQAALDRTVAVVKKVNEMKADKAFESVKDLTHLTTAAEIFNQLEANKYYTITIPAIPEIANNGWNGSTVLVKCITKPDANTATIGAFQAYQGEYYTMHFTIDVSAKLFTTAYVPMYVGAPTGVAHATTKSYVDGLVAAKANGNIKVQSVDGTQHDISGFDGSIDDKLLASLKFIEGTFETQADLTTKLATKQDTLTKTLTLHWDDGTTEDIKVG